MAKVGVVVIADAIVDCSVHVVVAAGCVQLISPLLLPLPLVPGNIHQCDQIAATYEIIATSATIPGSQSIE